ncbi:hypothetical protein Rs2_17713 [Raphanus sativus]|nr:hypothetical protein Rs2_17713 [Raphanus sativus]
MALLLHGKQTKCEIYLGLYLESITWLHSEVSLNLESLVDLTQSLNQQQTASNEPYNHQVLLNLPNGHSLVLPRIEGQKHTVDKQTSCDDVQELVVQVLKSCDEMLQLIKASTFNSSRSSRAS